MHFLKMLNMRVFHQKDIEKMSLAEVKQVEEENKKIEKENSEVWKQNSQFLTDAQKEIDTVLEKWGIEVKNKKKNGPSKLVANIRKELVQKFPRAPSIPHIFSIKSSRIMTYSEFHQELMAEKTKEKKRMDRMLLIVELAHKYEIEASSYDELDEKVTDRNRQEWIDENYPNGTSVSTKACDECGSWTVGNHRCECGNRRMSLTVEGDINNWYAYAEPY